MSNIIDKNDDILKDLKALGLDTNESTVYLSLLKLGEVGASKIVFDTHFHGQTVYDALYSLESKNLVRHNLVKGRKKFLAQNPSILIDLIEKQKGIASQIVEKIEKRFTAIDVENIEIIKGRESFVLNEFKHLKELPQGSELLILGGTGDTFIKNFGKQFNEYDYQRGKKQIKVRYIGSEKQREYLIDSQNKRNDFEYRFLPDVFSGITNITIFKNYAVVIYLFDETVTTIKIGNKKITQSYIDFFETLWKLGK